METKFLAGIAIIIVIIIIALFLIFPHNPNLKTNGDTIMNQSKEKAAFAAGCFWGVEAKFKKLGVDTTVGYMGGDFKDPSYKDVSSGETGHAEMVLVQYDPNKVSYEELLDLFWRTHDYTQLNRQGPDIGTQYRSAIFYYTKGQREMALNSKPVGAVTEIIPAGIFYPAEDYHQDYFDKNS